MGFLRISTKIVRKVKNGIKFGICGRNLAGKLKIEKSVFDAVLDRRNKRFLEMRTISVLKEPKFI